MKKSVIGLTTLLATLSELVNAHPGHGTAFAHGDGVLHPNLGGEHVLLLGAIGIVALLLRRAAAGTDRRNKE